MQHISKPSLVAADTPKPDVLGHSDEDLGVDWNGRRCKTVCIDLAYLQVVVVIFTSIHTRLEFTHGAQPADANSTVFKSL